MKRIISLLFVAVLMLSLCSCGKKNRIMYNLNLNRYVKLGDYKGLELDLNSDEYKENYNAIAKNEVEQNGFYIKLTEGKVEKGHTVNIDYVGKKDGVAFEGGTANGYDLKIGSGSFIDGFEDGLIGAQIGSTVDLNLTFPEDYDNEELNGAAVVFTVKVNYVTTDTPLTPEEYYKELNYSSVTEYYENLKKTAIENTLLDMLLDGSKTKDYPKKDKDYLTDACLKTIESNLKNAYGTDLETYLGYAGQTMDSFKESLEKEQINPMMDSQMVVYAVLDKEKLSVSQKDIEAQVDKAVKQIGQEVTAKEVKEYYGDFYFETLAVNQKVAEFLVKNAKIS